jgi:hypothetical protein
MQGQTQKDTHDSKWAPCAAVPISAAKSERRNVTPEVMTELPAPPLRHSSDH